MKQLIITFMTVTEPVIFPHHDVFDLQSFQQNRPDKRLGRQAAECIGKLVEYNRVNAELSGQLRLFPIGHDKRYLLPTWHPVSGVVGEGIHHNRQTVLLFQLHCLRNQDVYKRQGYMSGASMAISFTSSILSKIK